MQISNDCQIIKLFRSDFINNLNNALNEHFDYSTNTDYGITKIYPNLIITTNILNKNINTEFIVSTCEFLDYNKSFICCSSIDGKISIIKNKYVDIKKDHFKLCHIIANMK